jgi:hypothetical protein
MKRTVRPGDVYGKLTVVQRDGTHGKQAMWLCQCSCGNTVQKRISGSNLLNGGTTSCGCVAASNEHRARTHGKSNTRVYSIWHSMKNRCLLPTDPFYHRYGGRGITICEEWLSFENFYADMGEPPTDQHTLDRKESNGHYTKGNCRWATQKEQQNNRSTNHLITVGDTTATIAQWAELKGMSSSTIRERLQRGWSEEDAVMKPSRSYGASP